MMVGGQSYAAGAGSGRPWTFYALATLFGLFLLFLYGPMLVMYMLSFQGPHGGVTFPMVGFSTVGSRTSSSRPDGQYPGVVRPLDRARRRSSAC